MTRARTARLTAAVALAAALGLGGACTPPTGVTDVRVVSGFRVDPTFNAFTEACAIRYTLAEPAVVQIRVVRQPADGPPELVRQIAAPRRETAGPRTAAWRGVGLDGRFVPQGEYAVELYARLDGSDREESWTLTTLLYRS